MFEIYSCLIFEVQRCESKTSYMRYDLLSKRLANRFASGLYRVGYVNFFLLVNRLEELCT